MYSGKGFSQCAFFHIVSLSAFGLRIPFFLSILSHTQKAIEMKNDLLRSEGPRARQVPDSLTLQFDIIVAFIAVCHSEAARKKRRRNIIFSF